MTSRGLRELVAAIAAIAALVAATSATAATVAPAAPVAGTIARAPIPTPERVLLLGDSMMFDAAPAITDALGAGGAVVIDRSILGLGLTRADYWDWENRWPELIADFEPDAVVVFLAPFDLADLALAPSPERWAEEYRAAIATAVHSLGDDARILWVLSPDYGDETLGAGVDLVNRLVAEARADVPFEVVDVGAIDPADPLLRKDDGIHLCADGSARIADAIAEHLRFSTRADLNGEWRNDSRYEESLFDSICVRPTAV